MKLSFKTTTLIAAIGTIVYTMYVVTHQVIVNYFEVYYRYDLATEIRIHLIFDILPVSFIVACCGLWKYRPSRDASKVFRYLTIGLFVCIVGTLLLSPFYTVPVIGWRYLFPAICWRVLMLIFGIVWLFILRHQPLEQASSRSYRATLIIAVLLLLLPIFLEMLSGISCWYSGYVLSLRSGMIKSWVKWIAPAIVLVHFIFPRERDSLRPSSTN